MSPAEEKEKQEKEVKVEPEKDLVSWTAPARPFKRRNKEFYVTIIAISALVGLILFLVEGFMPVLLIISLVFLYYVLSTVEPQNIEYKITNKGVKIADSRTDWDFIKRFWFTRRYDNSLLIIETASLPGRLEIVIDDGKREEIKKNLSKYIPEEKTPPSSLDKAANWFSKRLPQ